MNSKKDLRLEFEVVKKGRNPKINIDFDAVVILSGESADSNINLKLRDTENRTYFGIKILKKIERIGGHPTLLLNGTDSQNHLMFEVAKKMQVSKIEMIKNPLFPLASTDTQIEALAKKPFTNMAIISHAHHLPRLERNLTKRINIKHRYKIFVLGRKNMDPDIIKEEIIKINKYFS